MRDRRVVPYQLRLKTLSRAVRRSRLLLVIEIDGDSHFTDRGQAYDTKRTVLLAAFNVREQA